MDQHNFRSTILCLLLAVLLLFGSSFVFATEIAQPTAGPMPKTFLVNGVKFPIPNNYVLIPGQDIMNTVFLFHKKYRHGLFVSVPSTPFSQDQLLNNITQAGLSKFFPKEHKSYSWVRTNDRRKVSKFEVGGAKAMGYNKSNLVIVQAHHFRLSGKDIFIGDIFEMNKGKEAEESFQRGLGGESMQGCNVIVEMIIRSPGRKLTTLILRVSC